MIMAVALLELRWAQLPSISFSHERGRNRHICVFLSIILHGRTIGECQSERLWLGGLGVLSLLFLS